MHRNSFGSALVRLASASALTGLMIATPVLAQTTDSSTASSAPAAEAQTLDTVQVTGTNIRRTDAASADNIQTLSAADIRQTGKETVADVLHSLSANFASYNETFSNSFSPGAAGIALRGLSQKNTLVLLNGQRVVNYGFAQNLEDTYVDLNTIPANAVDHIDILKDGASSIYGSDAIAGVVNIVLKSNYNDKVVEVGYGSGPAGRESTRDATATIGFGSLNDDGWNVMLAASYLKRSQVLASEVPWLANSDFRSFPGGVLNLATSDAYLSDANPLAPQTPFATCGGPGNPGKPTSLSLFPTSAVGTFCAYNAASQTDEIPQTERTTLVSTGIFKLSPSLTATADVFLSNVNTAVTGSPAGIGPTAVAFNPATGGVLSVPNTLPVGNPSNPGTTPQDIVYTFSSVGPQDYVVRSNTARLAGGLKGSIGSWDWEANVGISENDVTQTNYNSIVVPVLTNAIASGTYNFLNPSLTPGVNNALRTSFNSNSVSELQTLQLKATGDLYTLPAGALQGAVGYEFRHESINEQPDGLISEGQILGYGSTAVNGSRDVNAVFGELVVPIFKQLEADFAVREEYYSDAGNNFSPKASLRFQPIQSLVFRGSISEGFRAPSLPEISNASSTAFTGVSDPNDPLGRPSESIAEVIQANPQLKPEKSTNVDLGIVFSPTRDLNFSIDYYQINVRNAVAAETTAQNIVDDPSAYPGQIFRTAGGLLNYVVVPYANLYKIETNGLDFDASETFSLPYQSKFTVDVTGTYVDRLSVNSVEGGPLTNYAGSDGWLYFSPIGGGGPVPHLRGTLSGTWQNHDWTARAAVNYIGGYTEVLCALQQGYCGGATPAQEAAAANVGSQTTLDLYGEYRGIPHWTLYGSVANVLNRRPPFDAYSYPFDITMYDVTGRFISFHAEYKF